MITNKNIINTIDIKIEDIEDKIDIINAKNYGWFDIINRKIETESNNISKSVKALAFTNILAYVALIIYIILN